MYEVKAQLSFSAAHHLLNYDTFGILMNSNIKKIQGSDTHVGKHPKYQKDDFTVIEESGEAKKQDTYEEKLAILQSRLKEAIEEEEYEQAAHYRDEIRSLQRKEGPNAEMV